MHQHNIKENTGSIMIGIFDSGLGGISVLREVTKILPHEKYIYYADSANCPYGEKSGEFITARAISITEYLISEGADLIIVACNTATAAAIESLRSRWADTPIVGMEPAIKPAAESTKTGVIGILATAGTLGAEKYYNLRSRYSENGVRIVEHVGRGFVELVEKGILEGPEAISTVKASLQPLLDQGADRIVLGCTHYPFLSAVIKEIAGPDVEIIDPAPAVAAQAARLYRQTDGTSAPEITLLTSGDPSTVRADGLAWQLYR